ncbi:hypothetical protein SAMN04488128_1011404 [Chitinophaga eiseniae]|uniref:Uncharacterized protein n=1 Tax=Chitinophaga eiseniae TaxID=634771 RepID=A0A1T4N3X0_9BACT|nr:hypothetical protein [Chitinophaga eiseniae]SJZ73715.1 hypothetical protein SAMN04488128_1011404 [Chitinophaga eiseniae]
MAKQTVQAVKSEIQGLAIGNYKSYPEQYESTAPAALISIQELAKGYWDCRDYKEVARDEKLGINLEDYQLWTKEAHSAFLKANGHSLN